MILHSQPGQGLPCCGFGYFLSALRRFSSLSLQRWGDSQAGVSGASLRGQGQQRVLSRPSGLGDSQLR